MTSTKSQIRKEIRKAQERLKVFEEHTGLTYKIDKDYYLNMKDTEKAINKLKAISWKNVGTRKRIDFKGIEVRSINELKGQVKNVELVGKEKYEYTKLAKQGEKVTGEKTKIIIYSEEAKPAAEKYMSKRQKKRTWKKFKAARDAAALNNYKNKLNQMISSTSDTVLQAVAKLVKKKINDGKLTAEIIKNSELWMISGINMFDSKVGDVLDVTNAEHILTVLRETIPITDDEITKELLANGMKKEDIEEIL